MKLTTRAIKTFAYAGGWDVRWDDDVPGLGVRVYPSGKRAFVLSYRSGGRKRLMVLGRFGGDLTLDQARDAAREQRVGVRKGLDPLDEKRKAAQGETFDDLIDAYMERHARPHKKTWKTDLGRLERHIPAAWKRRKASSISREDIGRLHGRIGETRPYEANRLIDLLRVMFRLARLWYFVKSDADNPAEGITKFKEHKRKRWVTPEELPRLAQAIDQETNIYVRSAIWLYLLTGLRKTELLAAKRADIDWDRAMLRLTDTKAGEEQEAALSAPALAILQATPAEDKNPYILPGKKRRQHLVNINKPWLRIRKAAGLEDVRLHDLRRTTGSWLTQAGVDLGVIKKALRHANIATTLIYAQLGADPARDAIEAHGQPILAAAGKRGPVEVVGGAGKK